MALYPWRLEISVDSNGFTQLHAERQDEKLPIEEKLGAVSCHVSIALDSFLCFKLYTDTAVTEQHALANTSSVMLDNKISKCIQ